MKRLYLIRHRPGISLFIAIIFASGLMLLSAGLAEVYMKTIESINNARDFVRVTGLADGVEEVGRGWAYDNTEGQNSRDEPSGANSLANFMTRVFNIMGREVFIDPCVPAGVEAGVPLTADLPMPGHVRGWKFSGEQPI